MSYDNSLKTLNFTELKSLAAPKWNKRFARINYTDFVIKFLPAAVLNRRIPKLLCCLAVLKRQSEKE